MTEHPTIQNVINGMRYLLRRYQEDRCSEIAVSRQYMSLFALVPLLTVVYAIGGAVPTATNLQDQLQSILVDNLLPEASQEVANYISSFSQQAKNLTGVGIAILAATAVLMLRNVERAFNNIWRNRKNRGAVSGFPTVLGGAKASPQCSWAWESEYRPTCSPLPAVEDIDLLGDVHCPALGFCLWSRRTGYHGPLHGRTQLRRALPSRLRWRAFCSRCLCRCQGGVHRRHCELQLCTGLRSLRRGAYFSPLALYHLDHSAVGRHPGAQPVGIPDSGLSGTAILLKALDVLYLLWRAQKNGKPLGELAILGNRDVIVDGLDSDSWRSVQGRMISANLITQNMQGQYLLSQDLHNVTVIAIKSLINHELPVPRPGQDAQPWQLRAAELLMRQRTAQSELLDVSLDELFNAQSGEQG